MVLPEYTVFMSTPGNALSEYAVNVALWPGNAVLVLTTVTLGEVSPGPASVPAAMRELRDEDAGAIGVMGGGDCARTDPMVADVDCVGVPIVSRSSCFVPMSLSRRGCPIAVAL